MAKSDLERQVSRPRRPYRSAAHLAWVTVILLTMMYALSFIDRLILAVLANPIAQSLRLSDAQIGFLAGTSFAVLYSVSSLPSAQLIDTANRKRLVLVGVILWSAMTVASCFAVNLTSLLISRSGVALGEAVLVPAAVSMVGDLFSKERRALPMTVFSSMAAVMSPASFMLGGMALALAGPISARVGLEPWRLTFVMVGAPGLVLALIFWLLVREPARTSRKASEEDDEITIVGFLRYIRRYYWFYAPLLLSQAALAFFAYALLSWAPTIMIRAHGFAPAAASFVFGLLVTPLSLAAIYFWPWLAMRIERRRANHGVPTSLLFASLLALPFFILAPLMTNRYLFVGGICLATMATIAWGVLPSLGFQIFCPKRMRGRLAALNLLLSNLVGYGLGPVLAVYFGHLWKNWPVLSGWGIAANPLARGLATDGLIAAPVMIACTFICLRTAKRMPVIEGAETASLKAVELAPAA